MQDEITEVATSVVRSLTGGRWQWPPVRVTERYPAFGDRIRLTGTPIREVTSVTRLDTGEDVPFTVSGTSWLALDSLAYLGAYTTPTWQQQQCPSRITLEVVYEYGAPPNAAIRRAIDRLSEELELSIDDPDTCRLPERVTSVSRQGVSWTILDPQDFLTKGRTGLYEVDLALASANRGGAKARARVFTAKMPPADRRSYELLPLPSEA